MNIQNTSTLKSLYHHFGKNEYAQAIALCDSKVTFQIGGKSRIAGKYDATGLAERLPVLLKELSNGQYQLEVHDVLASDRHGVVLASVKFLKNGATVEYRTAHVWRIESGKPVAGYEYTRDTYQFDAIWS